MSWFADQVPSNVIQIVDPYSIAFLFPFRPTVIHTYICEMNMYHFAVGNGVQEPLLLLVASFLGSALTMMKIKKKEGGEPGIYDTGPEPAILDWCGHCDDG